MRLQEFHQLKIRLNRPLIMAHRGASALLPENTLSAFQQAVDDGADFIETDLHFTKDDELVLIHDDTLDRTVEAEGRVRDFTLAELKRFNIRQPPARRDVVEHIPTLRELIELTHAQIPLALELKDPLFNRPDYGEKLVALLAQSGLLGRCAVISFDKQKIRSVEQLAPELIGGWITLINPLPAQPAELLGPFWPLLVINPFYVWWAHKLGKLVAPLDPAPESRMGLYLKLNVDVILTDNPAKTRHEIERRLPPK